eukprot:3444354-Rhodomonas_salina.8
MRIVVCRVKCERTYIFMPSRVYADANPHIAVVLTSWYGRTRCGMRWCTGTPRKRVFSCEVTQMRRLRIFRWSVAQRT